MGLIRVLTPEVRAKIAAGEVIARPNSVIKELVENSLDANAKRIEVEIEDGGKQKCLVNDDGVGMSKDDARLSIERYATSKIANLEDIENIKTFGFRGEALASIALISYFELETSDGVQGTRIEVAGGEVKNVFDSHRTKGTKIKVSNLFFNLPARLKFLKSSEWERRLIIETVKNYSLIYPGVNFSLNESNRQLLNLAGVDSVENRLMMLFPKNVAGQLISIEMNIGSITIFGFFSPPDFFEKHNFSYIYINNRPVKYPRIYRTILEIYQNPQNPPAFLLNIIIAPQFVDVNIHPTKNEVKFKDEGYVIDLLTQAIKKEIFRQTSRVGYQPSSAVIEKKLIPEFTALYETQSCKFVQESVIPYEIAEQPGLTAIRESVEFWQLHNTYILTPMKSGMIIVDQHVAHERIIYESIISGKSSSQRLLFPITIELSPEEYQVYQKTKDMLKDLGVEFKEFSSRTLVIDSLPTDVKISREDLSGFFSEIGNLGNLMKEKLEVAKIIACRSAIKAGQKLSPVEMQSLIDRLFACENPYICPHGRPIVLKFTLEDLARKFGR